MPVGTGGQRSRWESSQYPARVPQEQGCDGVVSAKLEILTG